MGNSAKGEDKKTVGLDRELLFNMLGCLLLALYWVVFIWDFWQDGIYALGLNAFLFLLLALGLFARRLYKKKRLDAKDAAWIIPLVLISTSYALYDNPFLNVINFLVWPAVFAWFINFASLRDKAERYWDIMFLEKMAGRILSILQKIREAITYYIRLVAPGNKDRKSTVSRIILGIFLFVVIAATIIIPLLSSADSIFASRMGLVLDWIEKILSGQLFYKAIVFSFVSVFFLSGLLAWTKGYDYQEKEAGKTKIDPIVSGIVLSGILGLYLLFLWVQIERLWVGRLPFEFEDTEQLVKSGFWQLFFLSAVNVLIYFFTYRKTNRAVQNILAAFTAASLLLLISAGQRMGLYVVNYGLSYEKFFASYTVLYCAILFGWLMTRMFISKRADIFKFLVLLFVWMYSLVTVMPVEQIILRANVALAQRPESRVRLFELTMLSPDVLDLIKKYQTQGALEEKAGYFEREQDRQSAPDFDWQPWIDKQEKLVREKQWYEKNLMNLLN